MWNCLWVHAPKRSPWINRKSRVSYPGPWFLSSVTWPSLPKKHYNGLINQSIILRRYPGPSNRCFWLCYLWMRLLTAFNCWSVVPISSLLWNNGAWWAVFPRYMPLRSYDIKLTKSSSLVRDGNEAIFKTCSWQNTWCVGFIGTYHWVAGFLVRVSPKTPVLRVASGYRVRYFVINSTVTFHINGLHNDRSALCLYTVTYFGFMHCLCGIKDQYGK